MMDTKTLSFEVPRFTFASSSAAQGHRVQSEGRLRASPVALARGPAEVSCAKTISFETSFKFKMALDFQLPSTEWSPQDAKTFSFETGRKLSLKDIFGASALAAKTFSFDMA